MLTLYGFGPLFGLPEPCPFVLSAMTQLKMAGVPFELEAVSVEERRARDVPLARDGDVVIEDAIALASHLHRAHGIDLDATLPCEHRAVGWTLERMLETHLYGAIGRAMERPDEDAARLARRDFQAAAAMLGDKPFLFGDAPARADAALFGFCAAAASPLFDPAIREAAERYPNLIAHQWRMLDRYYEPA
jgi:glutathione S-transferase